MIIDFPERLAALRRRAGFTLPGREAESPARSFRFDHASARISVARVWLMGPFHFGLGARELCGDSRYRIGRSFRSNRRLARRQSGPRLDTCRIGAPASHETESCAVLPFQRQALPLFGLGKTDRARRATQSGSRRSVSIRAAAWAPF